ncbi:MAG: multicopper oxidase domain-containing protein, partial [Candidatus Bathyarchaeota archaeon]|nr:multicopper oxidase domain-containing protein [Candidatus Bathyarchaeota archaeon]
RSGPYLTAWMTNNMPLMNPVTMMPPLSGKPIWPGDGQTGLNNLAPYLQKTPVLAGPGVFITEHGWKDTIQMNPGEVTTIRVRFKPIDWDIHQTGAPLFGYQFDPTTGPGYVWHCHILDHEDNEMMRPYTVSPYTAPL